MNKRRLFWISLLLIASLTVVYLAYAATHSDQSPPFTLDIREGTKIYASHSALSNAFEIDLRIPSESNSLEKVSGDYQRGGVGSVLPGPLVVRVLGQNSLPVENVMVSFKTDGGASVIPEQATTDEDGLAQTTFTLGTQSGKYSVTASIEGASPVVFTATATAEDLYKMELSFTKGVNIISLPLQPEKDYTASTLTDELGSTIIIRSYEGEFQVYVPGYELGLDFPIEAAKGYIVNFLKETKFILKGRMWDAAVPAAPSEPHTDTWAFVIAGSLSDEVPENASLLVTNHRTGQSATAKIDESGQFATAFVDMTKRSVAAVGDEISLQILDARGNSIGQAKLHHVTPEELARAYILSTLNILPAETQLLPNYPNPFNPETWIPFQLSEDANVTISIYDVAGSLIRTLHVGERDAGSYVSKEKAAHWNGKNEAGERVANGVYFYTLQAGQFRATRKMLVVE